MEKYSKKWKNILKFIVILYFKKSFIDGNNYL